MKVNKQKNKIPKLRFPGFSGEWEEKRLGDLLFIERGASPRPINRFITKSNDGIPWIKIGDIEEGGKYITRTKEKIIENGVKKSRKVKVGDFILSNSMSFGRPYILKIEGCIHDGWLLLRNTNKNVLSNNFLYEVLSNENTKKKFLSLAAGSTVRNLKSETVKETKIFIPTLPEQQKIASFLGAVDERIEVLKKKREGLEKYKKGIMQKIFPAKGEKVPQIRFKDDNGKSFPDWEEKRLGKIIKDIIDNRGKTPPIEFSGVPLIEVNAIGNKSIDYSKVKKYVSDYIYNTWFRKYMKPGDILFSTVGATALCSIYKGESKSAIAQNIVGLRFKINSNFAYYLLTERKNNFQFKRIEMVAVQPSVKVTQMIKIKFLIPSLLEQQKIASFLSAIDKKIELVNTQIQKMQEWKRSLMQGLFV